MFRTIVAIQAAALLTLVACSEPAQEAPPAQQAEATPEAAPEPEAVPEPELPDVAATGPADGEIDLPADYKSWRVFLSGVEKPDTKQIRDIYISPVAADVAEGSPLPDGSSLVMEIYTATEADGGLAKGDLSKIFVMTKNEGWGGSAAIPNGNWVYGAFEPDGSAAQVDYNTCRSCHVPVASEDFVHNLTDYIASR